MEQPNTLGSHKIPHQGICKPIAGNGRENGVRFRNGDSALYKVTFYKVLLPFDHNSQGGK